MPTKPVPSYRHHKASGQAIVTIAGRDHYLGKHGSRGSRQKYARLIAEADLHGGHPLVALPSDRGVTVVELMRDFVRHCKDRYVDSKGRPTSTMSIVRLSLRPVRGLYGRTPAAEFGPLRLKAVRAEFVKSGATRTTINQFTAMVRRMFKFGVANELVPASVYHGLQAVEGLRRGEADVPENRKVMPVPEAHVDAARAKMSRVVAAVVDLQLRTGARPSEILRLRPIDFDTTGGDIWEVVLDQHKTAIHGRERRLYFGPAAQEVLKPFISGRAVHACLFDPREAVAVQRAEGASVRRRPNQLKNTPKTARTIGDHYTADSYRRAIHNACDAAGLPRWSPYRLRHNAATIIRREFGLEAAQVILGHSSATLTDAVYAERDRGKALEVIRKIG